MLADIHYRQYVPPSRYRTVFEIFQSLEIMCRPLIEVCLSYSCPGDFLALENNTDWNLICDLTLDPIAKRNNDAFNETFKQMFENLNTQNIPFDLIIEKLEKQSEQRKQRPCCISLLIFPRQGLTVIMVMNILPFTGWEIRLQHVDGQQLTFQELCQSDVEPQLRPIDHQNFFIRNNFDESGLKKVIQDPSKCYIVPLHPNNIEIQNLNDPIFIQSFL